MSAAKSFVLAVLRLLTPADLGKLTESFKSAQAASRMAAGAELLVWEESPSSARTEGRILDFPSPAVTDPLAQLGVASAAENARRAKAAQDEEEMSRPTDGDFLLEERGRFRESEERIFKQNGLASYQRSSDLRLFRVTETDEKGKEKTRLTSPQGVLINRKQA